MNDTISPPSLETPLLNPNFTKRKRSKTRNVLKKNAQYFNLEASPKHFPPRHNVPDINQTQNSPNLWIKKIQQLLIHLPIELQL